MFATMLPPALNISRSAAPSMDGFRLLLFSEYNGDLVESLPGELKVFNQLELILHDLLRPFKPVEVVHLA